jgi:hypothetical protein
MAERPSIGAELAVEMIWFVRCFRRGGLGPPQTIAPVTKRGRERVNASYEKHGWQTHR